MTDGGLLHAQAVALIRQKQPAEAERLLRRLITEVPAVEEQYDEWLESLADAYRALGRLREAGHVLVYLRRFADAHQAFVTDGAQVEAAHCLELWAQVPGERRSEPASPRHLLGRGQAPPGPWPGARARASERPPAGSGATGVGAREAGPQADVAQRFHLDAAKRYAEAGWNVHAAIAWGLGGSAGEARRAWERVARDPRLVDRPYEQALCHFNLGLAARVEREAELANRHLVRAQRLLEEVADEFDARGERERAFDCYALLLQLGQREGSFENVAEGYINCIRILKEDNLKFYALQYYEDFLRLALEREEFHAAATLYREAADYARKVGLLCDRGYLQRSAETWWKAAEKNERDGGPVELSENAYLAAVDAFSALGDFVRVRGSYLHLAALELPEKRRERYRRVAGRYAEVAGAAVEAEALPDYLKQQHAYPAVWEQDLVEWELDGDHAAVCAAIVGDLGRPGMIRRRALHVLLLDLDGVRAGAAAVDDPVRLAQVAQGLGELQTYSALRPLERLYGHPEPLVRRGVMKALQHLYFKRTFRLLGRGLRDEAPEVRDAALEALEALHFPHAFDPLVRVFREHSDHAVKVTALGSIGRTATLEAGEFLIDVMRHESEGLREVARRLLVEFDNPSLYPILRRHLEVERGPTRSALEHILAAR